MPYMILETFLVMKKPNLNRMVTEEEEQLNLLKMVNIHSLRFLPLLECIRKKRQPVEL
jgi:hypothetical protein